jgi:DNA-dependent protein kinase catalytic subunit
VSSACLNSLQQPLGIVLIEEYIVLNEQHPVISKTATQQTESSEEPRTKRMRLSDEAHEMDAESLLWIELAKLYRSMNDYDSIKGIFMRKTNLTTEYTKNGFYHESNNDYYQARKCYMDALDQDWSSQSNKIPRIEEELWQQSLLRCCTELTDWRAMCDWSTDEGSKSLGKLFGEDNYSLEFIFPYAFRSKLKLVLQGNIDEQKKHQDLIKFLHELEPEAKKYLAQSFCLEMALINLHQKDFNAAKYFAHMAIQKYLIVSELSCPPRFL